MRMFTQAVSREVFVQRLDAIKEGIERGQYVDDTLTLHTKIGACFWMRRILSVITYPISSLIGGNDFFASFRANKVATSIVAYAQANKDIIDQDLVNTKVVTLITFLEGKVKRQEQKQAVLDASRALDTLFAPPDVPPTPVVVDENKAPEPLPAVVNAAVPDTAAAVADVANKALVDATPPQQEAVAPAPAALKVPPSTSIAMQTLLSGEVRNSTVNFAYNVHKQLAKEAGSFSLSSIGLMDLMGVVLTASDAKAGAPLLQRLGLTGHNNVASEFATLRNAALQSQVTIASAYLSKAAIKDEPKDQITGYGIAVHESDSAGSVRNKTNEWVNQLTGHKGEVLDAAYAGKGDKRINNALMSVVSFAPELKDAPIAPLERRAFTCSDKTAFQTAFFGFQMKVVEKDDFKMVVVPYKTGEGQPSFEKVIFMPNEGANLKTFAEKLSPDFLRNRLTEYRANTSDAVAVYIPRTELVSAEKALTLPVPQATKLLGSDVTSWMQVTQLSETITDAPAQSAQVGSGLFIDRTFFYYVLSGDEVLLQGRVDDATALQKVV